MQQHAQNIGTEYDADIWAVGHWWRRKDGRFWGEVEPVWKSAEEEVEQRAAICTS